MTVDPDLVFKSLVQRAKGGDEASYDKIFKLLEQDLKKIANRYYIIGSDEQDVLQECRIGVWKAVKDYNESAGMTFKNFCINLCVKRHLITAMSHANTQKFKLQNEAKSLNEPVSQNEDEGIQTYADFIPDPNYDLLEKYIIREEFETNLGLISNKLTELEFSIFGQYAYNSSYKDIAEELGVKSKTVDNALMRIRKKASETYSYYSETHSQIGLGHTLLASGIAYESYSYTEFIGIGTCAMF